MSTETQAREVRLPGTRHTRYLVSDRFVSRPVGNRGWVPVASSDAAELSAAIRRIAELEEERERVRGLLGQWEREAAALRDHGPDFDTKCTLRDCADELRERLGP